MSKLLQILLAPFYFLVMVVAGALEQADAANWAARRLGLQGDGRSGGKLLIGTTGEVKVAFTLFPAGMGYRGKVSVRGELWNAIARESAPQVGEHVIILATDGTTLEVARLDSA